MRGVLIFLSGASLLAAGCSRTSAVGASESAVVLSAAAEPEPISVAKTDWPWWRGPQRNGVADSPVPPAKWSESENIAWKSAIPGRGHGSISVVGDRVFLAVAEDDSQTQSMLCLKRSDGETLWQTPIHKGGFETKGNAKSSHASSTPACDGQRVYINFLNQGAIYTTALSLDGRRLWQTKISDYVLHQGFASSPAIHQSLVLVSADNKGGGVLAGLDRATGKIVWRLGRPKFPNYTSPIVLSAAGREQLFFIGCDRVTSLDPLNGQKFWEIDGSTTECVTSTVTDGEHIFSSGGYPKNHVSAIRADGSGKVVWENNARVYVPSMLVHQGHLFAVLDGGIAACWKCDTGKEVWKARIEGTFSSSPVLVGDTLLAINEAGKAYLFKADPTKFERLGENQLGDEVFATPTLANGAIYLRVAHRENGRRQEYVYCIAKK